MEIRKHIDQLKKSGVEIESTDRGRLVETSAMNRAREQARAGCPSYIVVIGDCQTQGRSQAGQAVGGGRALFLLAYRS